MSLIFGQIDVTDFEEDYEDFEPNPDEIRDLEIDRILYQYGDE